MARASTRTILPLDTFAKIIGISPLHFNQVRLDELNSDQSQQMDPVGVCNDAILQYAWQAHDKMGREDVAQAIADAEALLTQYLGYPPGPTWITDEPVRLPVARSPGLRRWTQYDVQGMLSSVELANGYVIMAGVEAFAVVALNAAIVYSDVDGDGYKETATITVPTTLTDPTEIGLFYPGTVAQEDYTWEIRPITVRITGGNAVITCRREQLVKSSLMEVFTPLALDGEDDTNFLSIIDVYRHYTDTSNQATMLWDASNLCCCVGVGCTVCNTVSQSGCAVVRDPRCGLIGLSASTYPVCRGPDKATVNYKCGITSPNKLAIYQRVTTYLALTLLERPLCGCQNLRGYMAHWSDDFAMTDSGSGGGTRSMKLTDALLNNPLGTTRASIYAWRNVQQDMLGKAVING